MEEMQKTKYLVSLLLILTIYTTSAQNISPINSTDFVKECIKTSGEIQDRKIALWIPHDFWKIVGQQMKISPEFILQIENEMSNYLFFTVTDYRITNGQIVFKSDEELRSTMKFIDKLGNSYTPVESKNMSEIVLKLLNKLEPLNQNLLGQYGKGARYFLFDSKLNQKQEQIDISKSNSFSLNWDNNSLKWVLPFSSILPTKYCPVDKEIMKGNWIYCPIHGVKLEK